MKERMAQMDSKVLECKKKNSCNLLDMKQEKERRDEEKKKKKSDEENEIKRRASKERVCHFCNRVFTQQTNTSTSCVYLHRFVGLLCRYHPGTWKGFPASWSCCKNSFQEHPGCTPRGNHIEWIHIHFIMNNNHDIYKMIRRSSENGTRQ